MGLLDRSLKAIQIGTEMVAVNVRRNAQAKRMILRVDKLTGDVKVTAPKRVSVGAINQFVAQHHGWIAGERAKRATIQSICNDDTITYRGLAYTLVFTDAPPRRVTLQNEHIIVGGPADQAPARLERWLRSQAKNTLTLDAQSYADQLGVTFSRISIGDMKTRWGSCSSKGTLRFNWRLIMAPEEVRAYVAVHEVAHLLEMNHSADFWQHVAVCMPDYQQARKWLKTKGNALMDTCFQAYLSH